MWSPARTFVGDELLQPADLTLAGVEAVSLEFQRVGVESFGGAAEYVAQPFPALLDPAPATLEDAQSGRLVGAGEEREVNTEARIVESLRTGTAEQFLEAFLALCGDLVDHPAAPVGQQRYLAGRSSRRRFLGDATR